MSRQKHLGPNGNMAVGVKPKGTEIESSPFHCDLRTNPIDSIIAVAVRALLANQYTSVTASAEPPGAV